MESDELISKEEEGIEATVRQCIRLLLDALYLRIDADESTEEFDKVLGGIRIMTDPDGAVGKRVAQRHDNKLYASFFACVSNDRDGYELELQLVSLAVSPKTLADMIKSMEPDYEKPNYAGGLEEAIERISEVLFQAVVIPCGSPMYLALRQSTTRDS
jgi:hypothetical protein